MPPWCAIRAPISPDPAALTYLIRFQLGRESVCSQGGEEVRLREGDFALCDTARPYQLAFNRPVSILTLRVAKNVLQRYVGSPEYLVNVAVSGSRGAGALASRVIREIWKSSDVALGPGVAPRCANVVLELIACAYVGVDRCKVDRSCLASALRLRIMDFIDESLCDPDLSPGAVAQALKISTRHVHRLFAQQGGTCDSIHTATPAGEMSCGIGRSATGRIERNSHLQRIRLPLPAAFLAAVPGRVRVGAAGLPSRSSNS